MLRTEKKAFIERFNGALQSAHAVVVAEYRGLTVAQLTKLRNNLRKEGGKVEVAKNRLAKLALQGTPFTGLDNLLSGPTIIAYATDPVVAAKVAYQFAKDNDKFIIKGGALGDKVLDKRGIEALAVLPSLPELRAKLAGLLQAPATKLAVLSQEPAAQIARVLGAKSQQAA